MFDLENLLGRLAPGAALQEMGKRFTEAVDGELTESFLEILLFFMMVKFRLDPDYHKNIENFTGSYRFMSRDGGVNVYVAFADGEMKIREDAPDPANVTITFKNAAALRNFLLSSKHDILRSLLNNEVEASGNLNYLYKFGFMANHAQLELTGNLPS